PAFYLFCLALFGYLTFPYDRLKDRIILEVEQAQHGPHAGLQLEIGKLDAYWFSGAEVFDLKLTLPPDPSSTSTSSFGGLGGLGQSQAKEPDKEKVIAVSELHARLRLLPLLIGRLKVDFGAQIFGGDVSGVIPIGTSSGDVEVDLVGLDIGKIDPL